MLNIVNLKLLNDKVINFQAHPGEVILIKGPNGVGKSLFLKSVARLIPSSRDQLSFENKSFEQYPIELWRSKILYLPPEVSFSEEMTVEEYLMEPFSLSRYEGHKTSFDPRPFITNLSEKMNLLSSGQKQRVAILRAMSLEAEVLLLDESFSHMDQVGRDFLSSLLLKWMGKNKILLIVSHYEIGKGHFATTDFVIS